MVKIKTTERIKTLITNTGIEISALDKREFTNELDKVFESKKLETKKAVYDQALVDMVKAEDISAFTLHEIKEAEKNISDFTKKRKEARQKLGEGGTLDQEENGKINGKIIGWNEILGVCLEATSELAKADYLSRKK